MSTGLGIALAILAALTIGAALVGAVGRIADALERIAGEQAAHNRRVEHELDPDVVDLDTRR